jgi:hypothetical protein
VRFSAIRERDAVRVDAVLHERPSFPEHLSQNASIDRFPPQLLGPCAHFASFPMSWEFSAVEMTGIGTVLDAVHFVTGKRVRAPLTESPRKVEHGGAGNKNVGFTGKGNCSLCRKRSHRAGSALHRVPSEPVRRECGSRVNHRVSDGWMIRPVGHSSTCGRGVERQYSRPALPADRPLGMTGF